MNNTTEPVPYDQTPEYLAELAEYRAELEARNTLWQNRRTDPELYYSKRDGF